MIRSVYVVTDGYELMPHAFRGYDAARDYVAKTIREYRANGYKIDAIDRGREWAAAYDYDHYTIKLDQVEIEDA